MANKQELESKHKEADALKQKATAMYVEADALKQEADAKYREVEALRQRAAAEEEEVQPRIELGELDAYLQQRGWSLIEWLEIPTEEADRRLAEMARHLQHLDATLQRMQALAAAPAYVGNWLCDTCWVTWTPREVRYFLKEAQPHWSAYLDEIRQDKGSAPTLKQMQTQGLDHDQTWDFVNKLLLDKRMRKELIGRDRPEMAESPERLMSMLFEPHCRNRHAKAGPPRPLLSTTNQWTIPIIGDNLSGKTTYIASLIHTLPKILSGYQYSLLFPHDDTIKYVGRAIDKLRSNEDMDRFAVGQWQDIICRLAPQDPNGKSLTLFFKDRAGEYWRTLSEDILSSSDQRAEAGFLLNARAIMFLLDPKTDPELSQLISPGSGAAPKLSQFIKNSSRPRADQVDILRRVTNFLAREEGQGGTDSQAPPLSNHQIGSPAWEQAFS
jgi:hypothetical protein